MRVLGLDGNCDAIASAESKRKQYVRESAELYATDCNEEEEEVEEVEESEKNPYQDR